MSSVLNQDTLVLNKSWYPIALTKVKDAFCYACNKKALLIDHSNYTALSFTDWLKLEVKATDSYVRTPQKFIKTPELLLLTHYNKIPRREVIFCRKNLWTRDGGCCQYCGSKSELTIDHIIPRSRGGISSFENCVLACVKCNTKKAAKTLNESGMKLIKTIIKEGKIFTIPYNMPKKPNWNFYYIYNKKKFPESWKAFVKECDETAYWDVPLCS